MQWDLQRTIVAVSSGLVPAYRAIVRLSGEDTRSLLRNLILPEEPASQDAGDRLWNSPGPAFAQVRVSLNLPQQTVPANVYFWPDSRCFTGEPSAEIHVLGSMPIVESLVAQLIELGASPANRGEFTLRSFLAGKIDLTQAEAVLGVIEADHESQLNTALEQLGGNLSRPVRLLRNQLLELAAHLEAGLDFVEEDIEFITVEALAASLTSILQQLNSLSERLESRGSGSRTRQVVLIGLPNAGKSSLFNALLGTERAIVTAEAGTTRDAISEVLRVDDLPLELVDTAGIEQLSEDSPRALAQDVLAQRLRLADSIVFCIDLSTPVDLPWLAEHRRALERFGVPLLLIGTKQDLQRVSAAEPTWPVEMAVSAQDESNIVALRRRLVDALASGRSHAHSDAMHHATVRCKASIDLATDAIRRALELLDHDSGEELVAVELRCAIEELAAVIGEVHTEDILGEIFSRFCIGK